MVGPCASRIGTSISKTTKISTQLRNTINNHEKLKNVDLESSFVPAFISGQIYNTGTKEIQIAIGVNDTIQAVTNTLLVR